MEVGEVMFMKTTNETVQVLEVELGEEKKVKVRRPAGTKDRGIIHTVDVFYPFELVTEAESTELDYQRQLAEYKKMVRLREMTTPPAKPGNTLLN